MHNLPCPWPSRSPTYRLFAAQLVCCLLSHSEFLPNVHQIVAVESLHQMGYAHRDLKPENVLFTPSGQLVLADLGLAYRLGTTCDYRVGTHGYMAPEILAEPGLFGDSYDAKIDIWSLGITFLELFSKMRNPYLHVRQSKSGSRTYCSRYEETFMRNPADFSAMRKIKLEHHTLYNLLCRVSSPPRVRDLANAVPRCCAATLCDVQA